VRKIRHRREKFPTVRRLAKNIAIKAGFLCSAAWHAPCTPGVVVSFLRTKVSAVALVASMLVAVGGSVFAQAGHPVCVAKQHECGKTARISTCCCDAQDATGSDSTPVPSRVEVRGDMTVAPTLPNVDSDLSAPLQVATVQTSPPHLCLLDLPTLFVTFLI
jgi:hypothetical protein